MERKQPDQQLRKMSILRYYLAELRGVTMIEVLAALVIMGVIIGIATPNYQAQLKQTRNQGDQANLQLLEGAVKQFRLDTGIIPGDLQYLLANPAGGIKGWEGPYLSHMPVSPAGTVYDIDPLTGKVVCR